MRKSIVALSLLLPLSTVAVAYEPLPLELLSSVDVGEPKKKDKPEKANESASPVAQAAPAPEREKPEPPASSKMMAGDFNGAIDPPVRTASRSDTQPAMSVQDVMDKRNPARRAEEPSPKVQAAQVEIPVALSRSVAIQAENEAAKPAPKVITRVPPAESKPVQQEAVAKPWQLPVYPGVLEVIHIAQGHLNRIVTPFEHPKVKTVSTADIKIDGNALYVASTQTKPITLYVSERKDPSVTLSLALKPEKIPPKDIYLTVAGGQRGGASAASRAKAQRFEELNDYQATLKALLREIALQETPLGYAVSAADNDSNPEYFRCALRGFEVSLRQRLEGHHFKVGVHRITNRTTVPLEIREHGCYQKGVVAVAAWPNVTLLPGQSSELYIVQRSDVSAVRGIAPSRPSVIY